MAQYFEHRSYPLPTDERARLEVANRFRFLADAAATERSGLDQICELARTLLGVERAFVSLVLDHEQRFVARANLEATSTPRDISFCAHAVAKGGPLVVDDARSDERFATNPLVTGLLNIRFYSGHPLRVDGSAVGTFCVADAQPRHLSPAEEHIMEQLAALALTQLQLVLDMHDLQRQSQLLRQSEKLAEVGGWEIDIDAKEVFWSRGLYQLHEADPSQPVNYETLAAYYPDGEAERLGAAVQQAAATGAGFDIEVRYVTAKGTRRCAQLLAEVELRPGQTPLVIGTFRDLTQLREAEATRDRAQMIDSVTGLPNWARVEARFQKLREADASGSMIVVGLDEFRAINETRGRAEGDRVLQRVGQALLGAVDMEAMVTRVGGDEFAVLLPGVHRGLAILTAVNALSKAIENVDADESSPLSASLGVVVFPEDAGSSGDLLRCADIALQKAKGSGGKRVEYFAPELRTRIDAKILLLQDVRRGLAQEEFALHYQPICAPTGIACGFEALMRWNHHERGLLAPYHFMAAFDDPELSIGLGRQALQQAIRQMRAWSLAGIEYGYVAVNLSSAQLAQKNLATEVSAMLEKHRVEPHRLMLEVTESVYLDDNREGIAATLTQLRQLGVTFALDDFGTGYASLTHVKDFPIDRIKIDLSFVRGIEKDAGSRAIIRAILWLGKALEMQVVAEGVETAEQLEFLIDVGCELIQGYYFARPMPPEQASGFCRGASA